MQSSENRQHNRYHYERHNREKQRCNRKKHGPSSSSYPDRRSGSNSRTSSSSREIPHENEYKCLELDPDIDGVPMDSLPSCEPWKEHKATTELEPTLESLSADDQEFPNHCWVGEYLDEGEEQDIVPLSHDVVAKEILERQYWNLQSTNVTGVFADRSIDHHDADQTSEERQSIEFGLDQPWQDSKPTHRISELRDTKELKTEAATGFFGLKYYDDLYNSLIRPAEDVSEVEEQRELIIDERKLVPNRLAEVFDYGHGGNNSRTATLTRERENLFKKTSYVDSSRKSNVPVYESNKRKLTNIKMDDCSTKYVKNPESHLQSYSSYNNNEERFRSTFAETIVTTGPHYNHASDVDGFPIIDGNDEYLESAKNEQRFQYSASSITNMGGLEGESSADTEILDVENAKSTERGFPIAVLSSVYRQRQNLVDHDEIDNAEPVPTSTSLSGNTYTSSSSADTPLKVKPVFKKIRRTQGEEKSISGDERRTKTLDATRLLSGLYKGSFNDTRKVLLNEDKELLHRMEGVPESLSHGRIVLKYQPNEDMVRAESPSHLKKEAAISQIHHTEKIKLSKKPESSLNSVSVFPFFQDAEDANRRSDDSDDSRHSRSFQRRSSKHSIKSNELKTYSPTQLSANYMLDQSVAKKASIIMQPRELKRKLDRRNFKQTSPHNKRTNKKRFLQSQDEKSHHSSGQHKNDNVSETRSLSRLPSDTDDTSNERKSEDTRKFESRINMEINISERYANSASQSRRGQFHSSPHKLENSREKKFAKHSSGKEFNEASIQIFLAHDGSRSFNEQHLMQKFDQKMFPEGQSSTRVVRKEDASSKSGNDDFLNWKMNIQPTDAPTKRIHVTDSPKVEMVNKLCDITADKRFVRTTKLYDEELNSAPWHQEYKSWFNEVMHPILSHDKYAIEAGLLKHLNFLESVTKGNRRSLSFIPSGEPAKRMLKFIALNKDLNVSLQSKVANSNDHNQFACTREVLPVSTNLEVSSTNSLSLPSYLPLSPQREHALDRMNSSSASSSTSAMNALKKGRSNSFYVDKMPSKDISYAAKNLLSGKADTTLRDTETHPHNESLCQEGTYASTKSLSKPIGFNVRTKSEPKSSTQTIENNKKGKSWEDAISTSETEPRSSQMKLIESGNSLKNADVMETDTPFSNTALASSRGSDKKKNIPGKIFLTKSTTSKNEKHGKPSKDKDVTKTLHSKKVDVHEHSLLRVEKDEGSIKDKKLTSQNSSTKDERRSDKKDSADIKAVTKRHDGKPATERHLTKEHQHERQHHDDISCPSSEASKTIASKCVTKSQSTAKVTRSNRKGDTVGKKIGGIKHSSDRKKLTDSKGSKKVTDEQQASQKKNVKKTEFSSFASLDQTKVSCRAVNFKGEEYTCMKAPISVPTFTSEQERLLPVFKKQVEKSIIRKGLNVWYEFEKYRISRIFDVGNDILEQFQKSQKNSEFTADHAIYYIWCLFKDPTKNVLEELTRKLRKVNLDKPCFLENFETFMLFQRTVFNLCYDRLNPKVCYSAQSGDNIRYVRLRSENFFPQFYGESHVVMRLWSWYERMCSVFDNICATKKDAQWKEFPDYRKSSKSLEEKVAAWLKEILKWRLYQMPEALSINIVGEVDRQLVKKDSHATKEMVIMLVVKVWLQNYFAEETKSMQHRQKIDGKTDSKDMLENLVILDEVYSDESDLDEDKMEMDVDLSDEVSSLASVQVIDLF